MRFRFEIVINTPDTDGTLPVKVSKSPTTAMPFPVELDQNIQKSLEVYTDSYKVNNNGQ